MSRSDEVTVEIVDDLDPDSLERLTGQLRAELLELDVDGVEPVARGRAPDGSRGPGELAQLGALLVTVVSTPEVLTALINLISSWRPGGTPHTVRVEHDGDVLELGSATAEQQQALVDAWLRRQGRDDGH